MKSSAQPQGLKTTSDTPNSRASRAPPACPSWPGVETHSARRVQSGRSVHASVHAWNAPRVQRRRPYPPLITTTGVTAHHHHRFHRSSEVTEAAAEVAEVAWTARNARGSQYRHFAGARIGWACGSRGVKAHRRTSRKARRRGPKPRPHGVLDPADLRQCWAICGSTRGARRSVCAR